MPDAASDATAQVQQPQKTQTTASSRTVRSRSRPATALNRRGPGVAAPRSRRSTSASPASDSSEKVPLADCSPHPLDERQAYLRQRRNEMQAEKEDQAGTRMSIDAAPIGGSCRRI